MEGILGYIIELIAGAVGGNVTGGLAKNLSMGRAGDSIAGAIGGLVLSQIIGHLGGGGAEMAATADAATVTGGFDIGALVGQLVGGGVGGAILQLIAGFVMSKLR